MPPLLKRIYPFVCLTWATAVLIHYLRVVPPDTSALLRFFTGMTDAPAGRIGPLLSALLQGAGALLILLSAFGWGTLLERWLTGIESAEKAIFTVGLGYAVLITGLSAMGSLALLYRPLIGVFLFTGLIVTMRQRRMLAGWILRPWPAPHRISLMLGGITVLLLGYVLVGALSPEIFIDALAYHLTLPDLWLRQNQIAPIATVHASYFPLQIHTLYAAALAWGSDITIKALNFSFGILIAGTLLAWNKTRASVNHRALAVFLFLTTPFVAMVMSRVSIEMPRAFFELLGVLAAMNATAIPRHRIRWVVISAVFCGIAMGGHYFGLYAFLSTGSVILYGAIRDKVGLRTAGMIAAVFIVVSGCFVGPLFVRNFRATGVATYPFAYSMKNLRQNTVSFVTQVEQRFVEDPRPVPRTLLNFVTVPWSITMQDQSRFQEPFSGAAFLMLLPLIALALNRGSPGVGPLILYTGVYYACWFVVRPHFRFLLPCIPVISLLLSSCFSSLDRSSSGTKALWALIAAAGFSNLIFFADFEHRVVNPWPVVSGAVSRDAFLSQEKGFYYRNISYPAVAWMNRNLPADANVLMVGEPRPYPLNRPYLFSGISDTNPLVRYARESGTARDLYDRLRQEKITHILFNLPEAIFISNYGSLDFDRHGLAIADEFWSTYLRETYRGVADFSVIGKGIYSAQRQLPEYWTTYLSDPYHSVYVYELVPENSALRPAPMPYRSLSASPIFSDSHFINVARRTRN